MEKRRDGAIIEAGVQAVSVTRPSVSYKQNNDGTEEARIGPDMDMHRLIALYIVAPEMTTLVKARETETEVFETARAA